MNIIDLSQPLYDHMPVYPGDPEVIIKQIHFLKTEGWNLNCLTLTTHIGTHVNAPIHMTENGITLDDISLDKFMGECVIYRPEIKFTSSVGVLFTTQNIDIKLAQDIIKNPPKFIGLSEKFEFNIEVEKLLLEHDIISYENITNTEKLPEKFMFYGFPLNIKSADGSPVRAVAVVEEDDINIKKIESVLRDVRKRCGTNQHLF